MSPRTTTSAAIFALALACSDNQTGPSRDAGPAVVLSESPTTFWVYQYVDFTPPSVRIMRTGDHSPVPGVRVTFTSSNGAIASAVTDGTGRARADAWRPDYTKPEDDVIASADGVSDSVTFRAIVPHKVVAVYDLQSMGGNTLLPYGGGPATGQITGGHYVLFDDSNYVWGYEIDGKPRFNSILPYIKRGSGIEFYLSQGAAPESEFYRSLNYLFSTATLSDRLMSVKYSDTIDFDDEVYVLRK